jgi:hypothetical protein
VSSLLDYIDLSHGEPRVETYTKSPVAWSSSASYNGDGILCPRQQRVYFIPGAQSAHPLWHYLNLTSGKMVAYEHKLRPPIGAHAYSHGVYMPTEDRIFMMPWQQSSRPDFHFIDCHTGQVRAYRHLYDGLSSKDTWKSAVYLPSDPRALLWFERQHLGSFRLLDEAKNKANYEFNFFNYF